MYLLLTVWWPVNKGLEVGKKALEAAEKFPADESISKMVLDAGIMRTKNGIKAIQVQEVMEGKLEQAITRINEFIAFLSEIEGVNTRIDTMATSAEAMEFIGLTIPAPAS
jgi:hypothetical protein